MSSLLRMLGTLCILSMFTSIGLAQTPAEPPIETTVPYEQGRYIIGDRILETRIYRKGTGLSYIAPHGDETTSVRAVLAVIEENGGKLVRIVNEGKRLYSFHLDDVEYTFDPNRIFTDAGVEKVLSKQKGKNEYPRLVHVTIRAFADAMREEATAPVFVALHNNREGGYSTKSYLPGGSLQKEAQKVCHNPDADEDDFFFVTSQSIFDALCERRFNVVLQAPSATDDGSLSVYAGQHNIPYVNVEAQRGHLEIQIVMLLALLDVLQ